MTQTDFRWQWQRQYSRMVPLLIPIITVTMPASGQPSPKGVHKGRGLGPGPCAPWRAAQCASGLPPELWGAWTARPGEAPPRGKWSFKPALHTVYTTATMTRRPGIPGTGGQLQVQVENGRGEYYSKPRWATVRRGFRVLPDFRDSYCHSIYLTYLVIRKVRSGQVYYSAKV